MRIAEAARRHEVADEDMLHAIRNAVRYVEDDEITVCLGPARDGSPLEVGVLGFDGEDPVVVHAMPLRRKYFPYL
jgi:hypothetical protein